MFPFIIVFLVCVVLSDAIASGMLTRGIGGGTFSIASINVTGAQIP